MSASDEHNRTELMDVLKTDEIVYGLNGRFVWIRRKVWRWQRKAYEHLGWYRSNETALLKPTMIYRMERPVATTTH